MFHDAENIRAFLAGRITDCGILVIGDVMLDKYYAGKISRISPEEVVGREDAGRVEFLPFEQGKPTMGIVNFGIHSLALMRCAIAGFGGEKNL